MRTLTRYSLAALFVAAAFAPGAAPALGDETDESPRPRTRQAAAPHARPSDQRPQRAYPAGPPPSRPVQAARGQGDSAPADRRDRPVDVADAPARRMAPPQRAVEPPRDSYPPARGRSEIEAPSRVGRHRTEPSESFRRERQASAERRRPQEPDVARRERSRAIPPRSFEEREGSTRVERPGRSEGRGPSGRPAVADRDRGETGQRVLPWRNSSVARTVRPRETQDRISVAAQSRAAAPAFLAARSNEARDYFRRPSVAEGGAVKAGFVNITATLRSGAGGGGSFSGSGAPVAEGGPVGGPPPGSLPAAGAGGSGPGTSGSGSFQSHPNRPGAGGSGGSVTYYGNCPSYYNVYYVYDDCYARYYSPAYAHSWYYASSYHSDWCWPSDRWRRYYVGRPWWSGCFVIGGVYVWTSALYPWDEWNVRSCMVYPGYWDGESEASVYYTATGPAYYEDGRYVRVLERNHVRGDRYDTYLVNRGVTSAQRGQWEAAASKWRRALEINPDNSSAHYNLGVYSEIRGNFHDALHHYYEAASLRPSSSRYHVAFQDLEDRFPNLAEMVREDFEGREYGFDVRGLLRRLVG